MLSTIAKPSPSVMTCALPTRLVDKRVVPGAGAVALGEGLDAVAVEVCPAMLWLLVAVRGRVPGGAPQCCNVNALSRCSAPEVWRPPGNADASAPSGLEAALPDCAAKLSSACASTSTSGAISVGARPAS